MPPNSLPVPLPYCQRIRWHCCGCLSCGRCSCFPLKDVAWKMRLFRHHNSDGRCIIEKSQYSLQRLDSLCDGSRVAAATTDMSPCQACLSGVRGQGESWLLHRWQFAVLVVLVTDPIVILYHSTRSQNGDEWQRGFSCLDLFARPFQFHHSIFNSLFCATVTVLLQRQQQETPTDLQPLRGAQHKLCGNIFMFFYLIFMSS